MCGICSIAVWRACSPRTSRPAAFEIIVVDAASADSSAGMVRGKYPAVLLLEQAENVGFTRGNNIGLARAQGEFILLLNPDTEVRRGAINLLVDYLKTNPAVGVVGPHTLNSDGSHQSTRRRFPTLMTGVFESTWLAAAAPAGVERDYRLLDFDDDDIVPVDWVQGSALMLRRELWRDIGGLDESFVMYYEELDFCRRAKSAGWQSRLSRGRDHYASRRQEQRTSGGPKTDPFSYQQIALLPQASRCRKLPLFARHLAAAIRRAAGARNRQRRAGPQTRT